MEKSFMRWVTFTPRTAQLDNSLVWNSTEVQFAPTQAMSLPASAYSLHQHVISHLQTPNIWKVKCSHSSKGRSLTSDFQEKYWKESGSLLLCVCQQLTLKGTPNSVTEPASGIKLYVPWGRAWRFTWSIKSPLLKLREHWRRVSRKNYELVDEEGSAEMQTPKLDMSVTHNP